MFDSRINLGAELLRRGWIIPLTMLLCGAVAYGASQLSPPKSSATAVVLVSSGAGPDGPGPASDAIRLASTYSSLIVEDPGIDTALASALGETDGTVQDSLQARNLTDTALIELTYQADDDATAIRGARAAAQAVAGRRPASRSIGRDTVEIVKLPARADSSAPASSRDLALLGLVAGLALGLVLFVAWQRADPRADDENAVELATGVPGSRGRAVADGGGGGLLARWRDLLGDQHATVTLVAASQRDRSATAAALSMLHAQNDDVLTLAAAGASPAELAHVPPGAAIALVVRRGASLRQLVAVVRRLERFGLRPLWVLLMDGTSVRGAKAAAAAESAPESESESEPEPTRA